MKPDRKWNTKIAACLEELRTMGLVPEGQMDIILILRDKREPLEGNEKTGEAGHLLVKTGDNLSTAETLHHCLATHLRSS